jgi:diguanylate cyclase (GGDEF)-like protein
MGRSGETPPESGQDENSADRLRRTIDPEVMSVELVSAFAGDREMTGAERAFIRTQRKERGSVFFSDLIYAVSHHYVAPDLAEDLWDKVLSHKQLISERLGRNVRIAVATLDYLSNITSELRTPTLISEAHISRIADLSMRDGMTGLFNHTSCYEILELEFRSRRRYGVGVSLLLLDIDDFKSANDRCGHQEGDRVLVELAKTLIEQSRDSDVCCRIGGDEFVVILRMTNDPAEACDIGGRIRAKAASITCGGRQITVSVGVALCDHVTNTPRALMERADRALYGAKRGGKNQVFVGVNEER